MVSAHAGCMMHVSRGVCLQVEILAATTILITPCGGLGTVSVFLPPGATAIVMNYYNTAKKTSTQVTHLL